MGLVIENRLDAGKKVRTGRVNGRKDDGDIVAGVGRVLEDGRRGVADVADAVADEAGVSKCEDCPEDTQPDTQIRSPEESEAGDGCSQNDEPDEPEDDVAPAEEVEDLHHGGWGRRRRGRGACC